MLLPALDPESSVSTRAPREGKRRDALMVVVLSSANDEVERSLICLASVPREPKPMSVVERRRAQRLDALD